MRARQLTFIGLLILFSTLVFASPSREQPVSSDRPTQRIGKTVSIQFNYDSAQAVLALFDRKTVTDAELASMAKLPGNQRLIQQAGRFDPGATEKAFKESLKEAVETGVVANDPFHFSEVKKSLTVTRSLLHQVENDPAALKGAVTTSIEDNTPPGLDMHATVYFVVGGTSDGFALGNTFCVALHFFQGDYLGLKLLMTHELYHIAQNALLPTDSTASTVTPPANIAACTDLLSSTFNEGTATWIADPLEISGGGAYLDFFRNKYQKNLMRIGGDFTLFDTLLYRLYSDPQADETQIYDLGFTGIWDSPLYFVGYQMSKIIAKYEGRAAVTTLVGKNPALFFNRYIHLARLHKDDPDVVLLSASSEKIISEIERAAK